MSLRIQEYSAKAIVIRGDTLKWRKELKEAGGKWNRNLKGGMGWVFSKKNTATVEKLLKKSQDRETNVCDHIKGLCKFCEGRLGDYCPTCQASGQDFDVAECECINLEDEFED